ncbi:MAG: hypothetical protein PHT76_11480 [Anaerostipes sp.]|nr:hypothetical protein [Anaerostipes sp.]
MKFYYVNHLNQRINLYGFPYFLVDTDLVDSEWKYDTSSNKIKSIYKEIKQKTFKVGIHPSQEEKDKEAAFKRSIDKMIEVFDIDVIENQEGRIYTDNGYYLPCFVTENSKTDLSRAGNFMYIEFKVVPKNEVYWIKETKTQFNNTVERQEKFLDYPNGYAYDYMSSMKVFEIQNIGFTSSNFEIIIYGPCSYPTINIDNHSYGVNIDLLNSERLVINSISKKIYKIFIDGSTENAYSLKDTDSYIFEKIPPGTSIVSYDENFDFDIILFDERSEPPWT